MQVHFCDKCTHRVTEPEIERGDGYYDGRVCYCRRCMRKEGLSPMDAIEAIKGPLADARKATGFYNEITVTGMAVQFLAPISYQRADGDNR